MSSTDDEHAIGVLVARFADIANRGAGDEFAEVWHDDGEWVLPGLTVSGIDQIKATFAELLSRHQRLVQIAGSGHAIVAGDAATARWYQWEVALGVDGKTRSFLGVYDDDLVRTAGGWRFRRRSYHSLLRIIGDLDAAAVPWTATPLAPP